MTTKAEITPETTERIGAYRVVRRLATGGTSDVLLAKAEGPHGFERTVVLKVLLSHFGKDDDVAKMFAREASAYARLSHPCIVRLFDFFAVPADTKPGGRGGQLVMVLEHVDGPALARLKSMTKAVGKEIDDKAAIYIAACIFDALAAAHSAVDDAQIPAPVIHRDVNPSNVLIPWDGYPKLADFGVAKVTGLDHNSVVGMIKGTYGYMAPEQVVGEAVTPRADVYAAAIILWELLTKRRAFQRGALPEAEALRAMAEPRLPALETIRSDVDRGVRDALRRALEPRAEKRKITAEEMVSILHGIVPPDLGRERLMALLGLVRNDARAATAQASVPPPAMPRAESLQPNAVIPGSPKLAPDFGPHTISGVAPPPTKQGLAPQTGGTMAKTPPRPKPSSARVPVAVKLPSNPDLPAAVLPTTTLSSLGAPAPPAEEPHPREHLARTRPAMPVVHAPPPPPPPPPNRPGSQSALPALKPPPPPERTTSAAARLAVSLPPDAVEEGSAATPLSSILEELTEPGADALMRAAASPPAAAAPKDLTGGLGLRDAIDEILKSSERGLRAAGDQASSPPSDKPEVRETTRVPPDVASTLIGVIPPAPAPMSPSGFPVDVDSEKPPNPNEAATKPPGPVQPVPPVQPAVPNLGDDPDEPPREATMFMEVGGAPRMPAGSVQNTSQEPQQQQQQHQQQRFGSTLMMDSRPAPPVASAPMPVEAHPQMHHTPAPLPALPPAQHFAPVEPPHALPRKKGVGVGTVAVALILVMALGVAGTVAFVRYQAQKEAADAGAYVPPPPVTASETPVVTAAPVTSEVAGPSASQLALPVASASASASVSVPASASAAPPPIASASAAPATSAAAPVAEGMGVITTVTAAKNRRIFVDDKVVGETPSAVTVPCGARKVKLGSSGLVQDIDVPCGGEIAVGDKER